MITWVWAAHRWTLGSFVNILLFQLQLMFTLGVLSALVFSFRALWKAIGDEDNVCKRVHVGNLGGGRKSPFEHKLDVIKCWICSGMFEFYSYKLLLFIKFPQKIAFIVNLKLQRPWTPPFPYGGAVIFITQLLSTQDFLEMQVPYKTVEEVVFVKFFYTGPSIHLITC